jgi:hypothetical protein
MKVGELAVAQEDCCSNIPITLTARNGQAADRPLLGLPNQANHRVSQQRAVNRRGCRF